MDPAPFERGLPGHRPPSFPSPSSEVVRLRAEAAASLHLVMKRTGDAYAAVERGDPLAALDALEMLERRVGEARKEVKALLRLAAPRGAKVVLLSGRHPTRL